MSRGKDRWRKSDPERPWKPDLVHHRQKGKRRLTEEDLKVLEDRTQAVLEEIQKQQEEKDQAISLGKEERG